MTEVKLRDSGVPWLGKIPAHWELLKFSWCVAVAEGQVDPEVDEYSAWPLIAPNHVESGTGRLLGMESAAEQGAISGKYECRTGDVIYSKIRPALRKATIAPQSCLCSADMYPMRVSGKRLIAEFLLYYLLSDAFSVWAVLESNRVAMPKINRESLIDLRMPVPPLEEQHALVNYVSKHIGRIDALVAAKQRQLDLLAEKRKASIATAVTHGLDPETKLRDSGVQWLGTIPAHWRALPIKFGFARIGSGTTPASGEARYYGGEMAWINTSELRENDVCEAAQSVTQAAIDEHSALKQYPPGTVLFAMYGATIGRVAMLRIEATVNQAVCALAGAIEWVPEFAFYSLQASREYLIAEASGGGQPNLNAEKVRNHVIACPPLDDQHAIVEHIARETLKLDTVRAATERTMALLKERRAALIAAAVTGQLDVGAAA